MTSLVFPFGFSQIDLSPYFVRDQARSDGGFVWETEDADPYWQGQLTTGKLDIAKLAAAEAFLNDAVRQRSVIDFVDPIYNVPLAYAESGLPGGWNGTATLADLADPAAPVISGLPLGLVLTAGDRLSFVQDAVETYHMVTAGTVVSSITAQVVPIVPALLANVFATDAGVKFKDPVLKLNVTPNSWRPARQARQSTVLSFKVSEANVQT